MKNPKTLFLLTAVLLIAGMSKAQNLPSKQEVLDKMILANAISWPNGPIPER